ncbi:outer membrane protein assembly factor BamC [Marinobacterium sediminicola]|uniref:Beta-barrel assembly machine subunit BamC n=1 Tax=Marinobacterium sediminicola TaxID=518898 RepID=A0ABY1RX38_9GAMM|nr:outer membrane protein assembly factor BamC [Marinobacterium sediminicola]ULG67884.1 outer membrane protein assembly factor BamC [Marinobacterium sediminicola]SMR71412.1 Beta-barrel assembly machine subunit BamC [Marinobacterium sediminicola]
MTTLRTTYLPLALAVSVALTGCSMVENNPIYGDNGVIRDRSQDYELASKSERLQLPPHLRAKEMQEQLVVPDVGVTATRSEGEFEVPRPEFFYAESGTDSVNFRRIEGEKVILVDEPIADVWMKARDFWAFNDIDIVRFDPRQGVMESDWILLDGRDYSFVDLWVKRLTLQNVEGPTRNKLRMTLRPDPDNYGRTAVRIKHVQYPEDTDVASIDWDQQARDISYKSDMMFELLRYLSKASTQQTANTLVSLQQQSAERPLLGRDSRGNPVLKISAPIDTAWDQVNEALDAAQVDVGTRDQEAGIFYLTYTTTTPFDDTEKMGFFEWLHSDRGDIKLDTSIISAALGGAEEENDGVSYSSVGAVPSSVRVEEDGELATELSDPNNPANQKGYKIWFGGKVVYVFGGGESGNYNAETGNYEHTGRYQLKLNRTRSGVFLSVQDESGLDAPAIVAEEVLWTIKDQLPQAE